MQRILDDPALAPYRLIGTPDALAREGLFAVEGRLVLPRLLASRYRAHSVLVSEPARDALDSLLQGHPDVPVHVAAADAITALTGFDFHRGCLALAHRAEPQAVDDVLRATDPGVRSAQPLLILEAVSNPDNIGGIFRSAHAFGARGILLGPGCGDPLYRKAIRTSMGGVLDLPWAPLPAWPADLDHVRARGYQIVALTTDAGAPALHDIVRKRTRPIAFVLGAEGHGLSAQAIAAVDVSARIPMPNAEADSLNVAAAASIALYESSRHRE